MDMFSLSAPRAILSPLTIPCFLRSGTPAPHDVSKRGEAGHLIPRADINSRNVQAFGILALEYRFQTFPCLQIERT
jgi:hypothetical protein